MMDVQIKLSEKEFALSMGQKGRFAGVKDVQTKWYKEEFVSDMVPK